MRTIIKRSRVAAVVVALLFTPATAACGAQGDDATTATANRAATASQAATEATAPAPQNIGLNAVGLTGDGRLVSFRTNRPDAVTSIGAIRGLHSDTRLVGIDFRVQNGLLYGLGDRGGIYTIDTVNANATKVSRLSVALSGRSFGMDFNPAANRLRIISDTGQNLRHNIDDAKGMPAPGTTAADASLGYPVGVTTPAGPGSGVTAAAYTNNDLDARTATTLYDIDTVLDQVVVQAPTNAGRLNPTGKLTIDAGTDAGFDIYSRVEAGQSVESTAFATLSVYGTHHLFEVTLLNGAIQDRGRFPAGVDVVDIALPTNQ